MTKSASALCEVERRKEQGERKKDERSVCLGSRLGNAPATPLFSCVGLRLTPPGKMPPSPAHAPQAARHRHLPWNLHLELCLASARRSEAARSKGGADISPLPARKSRPRFSTVSFSFLFRRAKTRKVKGRSTAQLLNGDRREDRRNQRRTALLRMVACSSHRRKVNFLTFIYSELSCLPKHEPRNLCATPAT